VKNLVVMQVYRHEPGSTGKAALSHSALWLIPLLLAGCGSANEVGMVGTLERERIELKTESSEPLSAVFFQDGQGVSAGELILQQDPARAQARRAQQAALREQAAARLAELERGPRQEAIRESRARLESLQAQTVNAAAELLRAREVFDKGLSSQAALDQADASWKSAQAQETAAREALAALLNGTTPEELQQAAAALAASQALLEQAEIDLDRTGIRAPVSGTVDKVLFQLGERPPAGTTVAILLDGSRTFARIYVPEFLRARLQVGKQVEVHADGVERNFQGTVRWVSSDASFTPYFALTEHDRSRLSYLAEIDLADAAGLPAGLPLVALPPAE
jgi:HlyD family secretion protein